MSKGSYRFWAFFGIVFDMLSLLSGIFAWLFLGMAKGNFYFNGYARSTAEQLSGAKIARIALRGLSAVPIPLITFFADIALWCTGGACFSYVRTFYKINQHLTKDQER